MLLAFLLVYLNLDLLIWHGTHGTVAHYGKLHAMCILVVTPFYSVVCLACKLRCSLLVCVCQRSDHIVHVMKAFSLTLGRISCLLANNEALICSLGLQASRTVTHWTVTHCTVTETAKPQESTLHQIT